MKKRVRLTQRELAELVEARAWCASRPGWEGSVKYYDDLLGWLEYSRKLPRRPGDPLEEEEEER